MKPFGAHCAYQKLDSGIREFVFLEKSPMAVDEWLLHLDRIMVNDPPRQGVKELLLLDIRQHVPGAIYTAQKLYSWRNDYDLDDNNTCTAVLMDKQSHMVLNISSTIVRAVGLEKIN